MTAHDLFRHGRTQTMPGNEDPSRTKARCIVQDRLDLRIYLPIKRGERTNSQRRIVYEKIDERRRSSERDSQCMRRSVVGEECLCVESQRADVQKSVLVDE